MTSGDLVQALAQIGGAIIGAFVVLWGLRKTREREEERRRQEEERRREEERRQNWRDAVAAVVTVLDLPYQTAGIGTPQKLQAALPYIEAVDARMSGVLRMLAHARQPEPKGPPDGHTYIVRELLENWTLQRPDAALADYRPRRFYHWMPGDGAGFHTDDESCTTECRIFERAEPQVTDIRGGRMTSARMRPHYTVWTMAEFAGAHPGMLRRTEGYEHKEPKDLVQRWEFDFVPKEPDR